MAASSYQSLYRRYRPQRFSEVLGQDHVTRALRNAVRDGRIGHAYLFSGPRGTGKTSTARILAKVLNCAAPKDGEPDCECDNCVAVERGQVTDWLLEQDAASKSKVDDMRDLLDRVPLGTSGNRKVIILDEVHMLSQGAENALLKTLEEPPEHVVFVLATTDPQKVRPTIRSRTQHFEFHLLSPDLIADHVRHVIENAGLKLEDAEAAVTHVVRTGGGSARDTLSALDQVAALGEVMADTQPVDAILDALVTGDAGAALVAVAEAMATGRDARGLGEAMIGRLRDAFLAVMGAADDHLPALERARAAELGEQLGPSGLTRALEVLGEALTELSRKPDPRIVLEVALVRLTRPDTDRSLDGVVARLDRLENALRSGGGLPPASLGAAPAGGSEPDGPALAGGSPPSSSSGRGAEDAPAAPTGSGGGGSPTAGHARAARAVLAAQRPAASRGKGSGRSVPPPDTTGGPEPRATSGSGVPPITGSAAPAATGAPAGPGPATAVASPPSSGRGQRSTPQGRSVSASTPASAAGRGSASAPAAGPGSAAADLVAFIETWRAKVLPELSPSVRSRWRGGAWVEPLSEGVARFAVDNEWHQRACEEGRPEVEQVLARQLDAPLRVEVVVAGRGTTRPRGGPSPDGPTDDEPEDLGAADIGDVTALPDAGDVATGGVDLLLREFGGELVEEDPR